ncbi:MAG: hypothetical protein M3Z10_03825 [Gemmatimonadota bacterium]|nr:hypothetical protein [Gemmatimonadota bacterium]
MKTALGIILLVVGLLGHLLAAHAIGGSAIAYQHHIFGFFLILVVTGTILALLGWRFWRGRRDVTLLIVGVVQALFGIWIYVNRFNIS